MTFLPSFLPSLLPSLVRSWPSLTVDVTSRSTTPLWQTYSAVESETIAHFVQTVAESNLSFDYFWFLKIYFLSIFVQPRCKRPLASSFTGFQQSDRSCITIIINNNNRKKSKTRQHGPRNISRQLRQLPAVWLLHNVFHSSGTQHQQQQSGLKTGH